MANDNTAVGERAPDFTLPTHDGSTVTLSDARGKYALVWWYPKASTGTCTKEGCALRDAYPDYQAADAVVFGVSYDTPEDNATFANEHGFPYPLLSDEDRAVSTEFGVVKAPDEDAWPDMPRRESFLIDPQGRIVKTYLVTDAPNHANEVLSDIAAHRALTQDAAKTTPTRAAGADGLSL